MVGKRGTTGIVLMLIVSLFVVVSTTRIVSATPCADTDITCEAGCYDPGTPHPNVNCVIKQNQTVDVKSADVTVPVNWTFKSLTIDTSADITFVNSLAPLAARGVDSSGQDGGSPGGQGVDGAGSGGTGGKGVQSGGGQNHGGGGGSGGAGGQKLYRGGTSGAGIGGSNSGGGGGTSVSQDNSGAYVKFIVQDFEMKENSIINDSGQNGIRGHDGQSAGGSGGGGAGGAGGSGGGIIIIQISNEFKESGDGSKIMVNGGIGGHAGDGGDDTNGGDGGAGGGGGGGGNAGEVRVYAVAYPQKVPDVEGTPGALGPKGCSYEGDGNSYCGYDGTVSTAPGASQILPVKETAPNGGTDSILANCNDGIDNDLNGQVDMDDSDCHDNKNNPLLPWDATIWGDYLIKPAWYNESAKNASDLACGDDLTGTCSLNGETNPCSGADSINCSATIGCSSGSDSQTFSTETYGFCITGKVALRCDQARADADTCTSLGPGWAENTTPAVVMSTCYCDASGNGDNKNIPYVKNRTCYKNSNTIENITNIGNCISTNIEPTGDDDKVHKVSQDAEPCAPGWTQTNFTEKYCVDYYSNKFVYTRTCKIGPTCVLNATTGNSVFCSNIYYNANSCNGDTNCKWTQNPYGTSDLGAITPDNEYLCSDSYDADAIVSSTPSFAYPGLNYSWISPDETVEKSTVSGTGSTVNIVSIPNPYWIVQAEETHFISNGDKWFYCNATSSTPKYGNLGIPRGGTFILPFASNQRKCIDTIENIPDEGLKMIDCNQNTPAKCEIACTAVNKAGGTCNGWCKVDAQGNSIAYTLGSFLATCDPNCEVLVDPVNNKWDKVNEYVSSVGKDVFCNRTENLKEPLCAGFLAGPSIFNANAQTMNQELCQYHQDLCLGGTIPSTFSCKQIYATYHYTYPDNGMKLCAKGTEYCKNGALVYSREASLASPSYCCLGQAAYCAGYNGQQDCTALGGTMKSSAPICGVSSNGNCVCTGITLGTNNDCCVDGQWMDPTNVLLNPNESYVCYAQDGRSHIQECCGADNCNNKLNALNGIGLPQMKVFSMKGVPIHSLMSFDDLVTDAITGEKILQRQVKTDYNKNTGDVISFSSNGGAFLWFYSYEAYTLNWSRFSYLEFDIMYNVVTNDTVSIVDSNGTECKYDLLDNIAVKKGPLRWQHVTIPLDNSITCSGTLDKNNIAAINITIGKGRDPSGDYVDIKTSSVNVALDNFFLRPKDTSASGDSVNEFCSGDWGKWVKNLDGPTGNNGFIGKSPSIVDVGPYKDACNGVISFGWTGNLCCGDDTSVGQHGEYWKDTIGACWKGTTVLDDQTVADALGDYKSFYVNASEDKIKDELSLLYYGNALWSCDRAIGNYTKYNESYNGVVKTGVTFDNVITQQNVALPYTIKGHWFCETDGEGWVKLADINRVKPLAATLRKIGEVESKKLFNKNEYTLMCGNYTTLSNVLPFGEYDAQFNMTNNICVLKVGDNKLGDINSNFGSNKQWNKDGFVVIGLEVTDITLPFDDYKGSAGTGVLNNIKLLEAQDYDCSTVLPDVTPDSFFTKCSDKSSDTSNKIYLYYDKPLNIILISGNQKLEEVVGVGRTQGSGFVQFFKDFWAELKKFFSNLFSPINSQNKMKLSDFELRNTKDLYLSVQDNRMIVGAMEEIGYTSIRVDYVNLSTDVRILRDAIEANYNSLVSATYIANGTNKTIFVTGVPGKDIDWRLITAILRVNPNGNSISFPPTFTQNNFCVDSDGGLNYTVKGIVNVNGLTSYIDNCTADSITVLEYYCNTTTNESAFVEKSCKSINTSYICSAGACVLPPLPPPKNCVDSDGGSQYQQFVPGNVSVNAEVVCTDTCLTYQNNNKLRECYCTDSDEWASKEINCSSLGNSVCSNGACVHN